MESCCLEKLWHFLETNPTVLAVGSDNILMPTNTYQAMPHSQKEIELNLLKNEEFKPSVFLVRADSFKRLNGFNEAYIKYADYDFLCRLVLLGTVSNLPDALSYCICEDEYEEKGNLDEYINIQRIYQLNFINTHLRINQKAVTKNEISSMNLGLIISYYTYSYYYQEDLYSKIADQLLDDTSSSLSTSMPVTLSNGILGFACGIIYLIRNQFIEGDEDEILSEIDNMLYRVLIEFEEENQVDWYGWIYYSKQRLSFSTLQKRGLPGIIYQQNFIYMLDCLSRAIQKNIRLPKDILPEIEWMHAKKICPVTTKKILDQLHKKYHPKNSYIQPIKNPKIAFVIPLRVDSEERSRNLDLLLKELSAFQKVEIWILEADKCPHYQPKGNNSNLHYIFKHDLDPVFHRTKYLNLLLKQTTCDIVGIWDTDAFVCKEQILDTIEKIKEGKAVMGFPYDGRFYMLSRDKTKTFIKTGSLDVLMKNLSEHYMVHGPHSVGGAFLVSRCMYLRNGGENENFYGWGPEDAERAKRMEILGLPVYRAKGALFHLYHPRKENSWFANKDIELKNRLEFLKVCGKTFEELSEYIQTW